MIKKLCSTRGHSFFIDVKNCYVDRAASCAENTLTAPSLMNIRRLVDRIADALGPGADPARVEAIAAAVLDTFDADAPEVPDTRPAKEPIDRVIVTAYGLDKPGILAGITNAVSGAGCNIRDVSQKILQEYFTLIMIADISAMHASVADLQKQLAEVGRHLGVRIMVQREDLFERMHRP